MAKRYGENTLMSVVSVTPTLTVHATYATGDFVGTSATVMTFANVARVAGGGGEIRTAILVDFAANTVAAELWLFDSAITPPADSAAWTMSDADAAHFIGLAAFSTYFSSALNSISQVTNAGIAFQCGSGLKDIYGVLVTRGTPTYASGDLTVRLVVSQD